MSLRALRDGVPLGLVLVPALVSLAVTLLRLTGELLAWSRTFFNPEPGGGSALVGITWLAPFFGAYFALELVKRGEAPRRSYRAVLLALGGFAVLAVGILFQPVVLAWDFRAGLVYVWLVGAAAAAVPYPAWPQLFQLMLAYGFAARIPVVMVMFLAMHGSWSTHYDAVPPGLPPMSWVERFLWLGLFPQLIFWVGFTIVTGMLLGTVAAALSRRRKAVPA